MAILLLLVESYRDGLTTGDSSGDYKQTISVALYKQASNTVESIFASSTIGKNKGSICVGECATCEEAVQRKVKLIQMGFSEDIFHFHPHTYRIHIHTTYEERREANSSISVLRPDA